ncbi:MAG: flagellar biosynthesis protein FlhF [Deltaproteobacteria bacterium]|nr:flagellar biosynthesis protein FlhF [Deltaproteobacteria bacterium]
MRLKTYTVDTLSEAVDMIKRELGPEAVILNTRKVEGTGRWWLRERPRLEVTAAVDVNPAALQAGAPPTRTVEPGRLLQRLTEDQIKPVHDELKTIREFLVKMSEQKPSYAEHRQEPAVTQSADAAIVHAPPAEETEEVSETESSSTPAATRPTRHASHERMVTNHAIVELSRTLLWHQVDPQLVEQLADELVDRNIPAAIDVLKEHAAVWLQERIPERLPITAGGGERIITVIGPTGSGKTTTLVKLASQHVLERKRSVAFITLDHFRIGAEEQLRKYADILQVPCELATDTLHLRRLIERFKDTDLILIDTTGRSPQDLEGLKRIQQSLEAIGPAWRALCLPAALHGADLGHMMAQFALVGYNRLIMTKLDEAASFGALFNATVRSRVPLAYFTTGQRVPEDIEVASCERILDCLLNFSGQFPVPLTSDGDAERTMQPTMI